VETLATLGRPIVVAPATDLTPPELAALVPPGARSAIAAPIVVRGETAGWFVAGHDQVGRMFGPDEERLAELVARLAGAALDRLRFQAESKARVIAAQEAERSRVARDLHDEIGQALTGVLLGVRLVESATGSDEVHTRAEELRRTVAGAIDSVQRLAFALRPAVLDDLGLVAALRRLTEQAHDGLAVELETVDLDPVDRFAPEIETTAYRIVQESLTNVLRHSGATRASIVAGRNQHRLRIVVEDDGRGFDRSAVGTRLGLRGMRERAELVGGTLRVDSEPGRGTSVVFEVAL
jgi:signal transduction histidine kinase